jgi:hypothetical protein
MQLLSLAYKELIVVHSGNHKDTTKTIMQEVLTPNSSEQNDINFLVSYFYNLSLKGLSLLSRTNSGMPKIFNLIYQKISWWNFGLKTFACYSKTQIPKTNMSTTDTDHKLASSHLRRRRKPKSVNLFG